MVKIYLFLRVIEVFFGVIGGLIFALPSNNQIFINIKLFGAEILTPRGYEILPSTLEVIPGNSAFVRGVGGTALLTDKQITFAVDGERKGEATSVIIDGGRRLLRRGVHASVGDTGCFIWLYHLDKQKNEYQYHLKCSELQT